MWGLSILEFILNTAKMAEHRSMMFAGISVLGSFTALFTSSNILAAGLVITGIVGGVGNAYAAWKFSQLKAHAQYEIWKSEQRKDLTDKGLEIPAELLATLPPHR